ncbi:MAG: hypothetical protein M3R15_35705, partial [Acidobacteriota bacterium]|nr:hypothetical protein [Acidobacteriota bacterium]
LWSPQLWIDLERREYLEVRADCFRVRDSFQGYFRDAGARVRNITDARTVMALAYQRLNPERAEQHPCPEYRWEWNQNPRELICLTSMDDLGDVLRIGNRVVATLVLHRLPVKANQQTLERVLRSTALNFDVEFATHFEIGDWVKWDNRLAKEEDDIALSLDQSRVANRDETVKARELAAVRTELRESEEKIGAMGFAATVSAETPAELRRRADTLMVELRKAEGMETILDRAGTVTGHIATLPCAPHKDARTKPVMTRDAANLSGWTGGPVGVPPEVATLVFQRPDGGLVYVDQTSRLHGANQTLVCGRTRSGKSVLMNLLRLDHLARGRRGMVLDYRASGRRITEMIGGLHIDITDPRQSSRLGIFDIHPKSWEQFAPEALTPEGLPRDRVLDVERMLEKLCLDPLKLDEVSLAPRKRLYLGEVVRLAYDNKVGGVPTLDDFIRAAKNATRADRDIADDVAARLSLYGSGTSLGRFLNDQEEAADLRDVPLIYFDFRHAKNDPRLLLVATMAVQMVLDRYLFAQDQLIGTFLHLDEVQAMTRWPVLALTIDDVVRTAGKYNTHVTAGSQHPEDFDHPLLKSLAHNCEVKYLFQMPAGLCRRVFDLTPGQAQLVASLDAGGDEHRDCALISPTLTARLRLRFGPVDGRLLMEASTGREKFTAAEALQCLGPEIPARLRRALEMEVRGQPSVPQELMTFAAD